MSQVVVYTAPLVVPVTAPVILDGAVAVREGHVLHVGTRAWVLEILQEELDAAELADVAERHWDGLLTPGLVNAHTHLQYTGMAAVGQRAYDSFRAWELAFNAIYDSPEQKPWRQWAQDGARELLRAGTTSAADIATDMEAVSALSSLGLHGVTYWEVMDWENDRWTREGARTLLSQLAEAGQTKGIRLGISPHAPYSLESDPLLDLPDIARSLGMRGRRHPLQAHQPHLVELESPRVAELPGAQRGGFGCECHPVRRPARCARSRRPYRPWRLRIARRPSHPAPARCRRGALPPLQSRYLHEEGRPCCPLPRGGQHDSGGYGLAQQLAFA